MHMSRCPRTPGWWRCRPTPGVLTARAGRCRLSTACSCRTWPPVPPVARPPAGAIPRRPERAAPPDYPSPRQPGAAARSLVTTPASAAAPTPSWPKAAGATDHPPARPPHGANRFPQPITEEYSSPECRTFSTVASSSPTAITGAPLSPDGHAPRTTSSVSSRWRDRPQPGGRSTSGSPDWFVLTPHGRLRRSAVSTGPNLPTRGLVLARHHEPSRTSKPPTSQPWPDCPAGR